MATDFTTFGDPYKFLATMIGEHRVTHLIRIGHFESLKRDEETDVFDLLIEAIDAKFPTGERPYEAVTRKEMR